MKVLGENMCSMAQNVNLVCEPRLPEKSGKSVGIFYSLRIEKKRPFSWEREGIKNPGDCVGRQNDNAAGKRKALPGQR